jgi:hypothetical protein
MRVKLNAINIGSDAPSSRVGDVWNVQAAASWWARSSRPSAWRSKHSPAGGRLVGLGSCAAEELARGERAVTTEDSLLLLLDVPLPQAKQLFEPGFVDGLGDDADGCTKPLGLVHEGAQDVEHDGLDRGHRHSNSSPRQRTGGASATLTGSTTPGKR